MTLYIESLDGFRYDLREHGIQPYRLEIDSLSPRNDIGTADGADGHNDIETTYEGRTMRAFFRVEAKGVAQFSLLRDTVYRLFNGKTYFYLYDSRLPYKRWKVRSESRFIPDKVTPGVGTMTISLISQSPFAESSGTTLYPDPREGIPQVNTDEPIEYIFQQPAFSIWNDGDEPVDPRERWAYLQVLFQGASENLIIKNLTTGDEWSYTGTTAAGDTIELNGIRSLKNGSSIFGQTNRKLLTLAPGMNQFEISGATGAFQISFDFRFYYI
jgi:hypothetical protein